MEFCGPTSGNCALAYATALGFSTIFFAGLDFGQKNDEDHHSKHTLYYSSKSNAPKVIESHTTTKANFGGHVRATLWLDRARFSAERLINEHPAINYVNLSDGAYVSGAKPARSDVLNELILPAATPRNLSISKEVIETTTDLINKSANVADELLNLWRARLIHIKKICQSDLRIETIPVSVHEWFDTFDRINCKSEKIGNSHPELKPLLFACLQGLLSTTSTLVLHAHKLGDLTSTSDALARLWNTYLAQVPQHCLDTELMTDTEREASFNMLLKKDSL